MSFRDQATAWVHDYLASIGEVIAIYRFTSFADLTEAERLIRNKFICRETVMKLDDLNLVRRDTGFLIHFLSSSTCHISTYQLDRTTFESHLSICLQRYADNLNCLALELVL
jgi:hypothetical protein